MLIAASVLVIAPAGFQDPGIEGFEARIRPLFVERCGECHGRREPRADLTLTDPAGLRAGSDVGPVLVPGDPDASRLIQAVRYSPELQMPPKQKLPDAEIALLEAWVLGGAPMPESDAEREATAGFDLRSGLDHWSFRPPDPGPVPAVVRADWPRDDLDRYVLARLESEGLAPAPEASRRDWLRRVHVLLSGLPPTPDELRAFLADRSPDAHERVVDELLAGSRFAVTWARHWLDLVRYSETKGHEFDFPIPNAWQYRDYVVRAIHADVPYDDFLVEHVAGDLLAEPRRNPEADFDESVLGTGFWWMGEEVHSPVDPKQDETDRLAGQIDVFGKAFMGLTVACARCHDHKFDPISQADYYALSGFLLSSTYRQARFDSAATNAGVARELEALADRYEPAARAELRTLVEEELDAAERVLPVLAELGRTPHPAATRLAAVAEQYGLDPRRLAAWSRWAERAPASPATTADDGTTLGGRSLWPPGPDLGVLTVDGPALGALRSGGLSAVPSGTGWRLEPASALVEDALWESLALAPGTATDPSKHDWNGAGRTAYLPTVELGSGSLWYLVRGAADVFVELDSHRLIQGPLHGRSILRFGASDGWRWVHQDLSEYAGSRAQIELTPRADGDSFAVASIVEGRACPAPPSADPLGRAWPGAAASSRAVVGEWRALRTRELEAWFRCENALEWPNALLSLAFEVDPTAARARTLGEWRAARDAAFQRAIRESRTAPALLDTAGFDEHLLVRGGAHSPGASVGRRFLEALGGRGPRSGEARSGRLELARALVSETNPLTARVAVNRLWHHLFGRGLAPTVDDFGAMGEAPSHPELLDHLARRFIDGGWSRKALIRDLVLSATFRQSSEVDPKTRERDPLNRLLARAPVRRLTAEALRDGLLHVSGELDETLGGPSIPVHLTPFLEGRGRPSASGPLLGDGRRSLYLEVRRNFLEPFLLAFDFPVPATTMGRRADSNVPAQALTLLNDPLVLELAGRFADRLLLESSDPERCVDLAFERALSREPRPEERSAALAFLQTLDATSLRDLAHVLFNTKEFRFLE